MRSFGNLDISTNGATLVRQITNIYRNLRYIAVNAGLDPVQWAISMPWALFYEITEVWPCAYLTYRCTNIATGNTAFVDSTEAIRMRDEMRGNVYDRTGQYLLIDGVRVPVVIDDGITELGVGAGSFRSSMYFVPLTVLGGTPTTFMGTWTTRRRTARWRPLARWRLRARTASATTAASCGIRSRRKISACRCWRSRSRA